MSTFSGTERYRVVRRIGAGAYGVVYEVEDAERDVRLAAKVLNRLEPHDLFRFKREFRRFADLRHPNLVRLHDLVAEGDLWFFTMELVRGAEWLAHVRGRPSAGGDVEATLELDRAEGRLDFDRVRSTLPQIVGGLTALHEAGFVHRDVKPSNVLVTDDGRVVVLDFGMAAGATSTDANHTMHAAGTPLYMAPEQTDPRRISPAADFYALGVMLYQALAGVPPFEGAHALQLITKKLLEKPRTLDELGVTAPPDLERLAMALLETDPAARPSASRILDHLRNLEAGGHAPGMPSAGSTSERMAPPSPACIGREAELAELRAILREAERHARATRPGQKETGGPRTVLVTAESGLGKSTLLRRFVADVGREAVILSSRCNQRESLPFKAIDPVVDDLTEWLLGRPRAEAAAVLPRDVGALCRLFPVFERVPAVAEAPRRYVASEAASQERLRAFDALREMLGRIADRRPVVLVIDDAQWGDQDSARLLLALIEPPDAPDVFFVFAARPDEMAESPLFEALLAARGSAFFDRRIALGPLDATDAERLATQLLGGRGAGAQLAADIAQESGGSPFFIEQLVRHVEESDPDESGRLRLGDLVIRRRRSISEASRALLDLVCVAGAPVARSVLARGASLPGSMSEPAIDALVIGGLARPVGQDGSRVEAYHDRIREQIVRALPASERMAHHLALAEALLAEARSDAEGIYRHFHAAGDRVRARTFAERAAADAMKALAFNHAAELYAQALALTPADDAGRARISEALGQALGASGRSEHAALAFLASAEQSGDDHEDLRLRHMAAEQLIASGEVERGFEVLWPVAARLRITWPRGRVAMLLGTIAWHVFLRLRGMRFRSRPERQIGPIDKLRVDLFLSLGLSLGPSDLIRSGYFSLRAMGEALRLGEPVRVARCRMVYEAFAVGTDPRVLPRVKTTLDAILDDLGELGDPLARAHLRYAHGMARFVGGYWVEAEEELRAAREAVSALEAPPSWLSRGTYYYWLIALTLVGGYRELTEQVRRQLRAARERGDRLMETVLRIGEPCVVWLCADDPDAALAHREEAIARWGDRLGPVQRYLSHQVLVMAHLYAGRGRLALEASTPDWIAMRRWFAGIHAMRSGASSLRCRALVGAAAELSGAEAKKAEREAERLARAMLRERAAWSDALAHPVLAAIAHQRGDVTGARRHLEAAVAAAETSGLAGYGAASKRRLGELVGGAEGDALLAEAAAFMAAEGVRDPLRFTRALAPGFPDAAPRSTTERGRDPEAHALAAALGE